MTYDEINSVWYYNGNFPVTHQEIKFFGDYEPLIVDNYGYRFSKEGFLNNFVWINNLWNLFVKFKKL